MLDGKRRHDWEQTAELLATLVNTRAFAKGKAHTILDHLPQDVRKRVEADQAATAGQRKPDLTIRMSEAKHLFGF